MKSRNAKSPKKRYRRPRLLVYGDLRALTQAVGNSAKLDGAGMMLMIKS